MSLDGYDVDTTVAVTARSTILRARQRSTGGRTVAVKRIARTHPAIAGRLRHEADVLAALHHPHVVPLLDVVEDVDGLALVMPWADGGTLADQLAAGRSYTVDEVLHLARPLCAALASAHRQGVLHLDLKPANVLLTADGEPLLADFGIARWLRRAAPPCAAGTPGFIAPEVLAGADPDARADVFGMGALARALLGGELSGAGRLRPVLERCLADDPAARFPTMAALGHALGADGPAAPIPVAARTGPDTRDFGPRPPCLPTPQPPTARRRRGRVLVGSALATVAVLVAAVGARASARHQAAPVASRICPRAPRASSGDVVVRAPAARRACPLSVLWSPASATLTVAEHGKRVRYAVGQPGDRLLLGAWAPNSAAVSPALYRPSTGELFLFSGWASEGRPMASSPPRRMVPDGEPTVVRDGDHDRVVVRRAGPAPEDVRADSVTAD